LDEISCILREVWDVDDDDAAGAAADAADEDGTNELDVWSAAMDTAGIFCDNDSFEARDCGSDWVCWGVEDAESAIAGAPEAEAGVGPPLGAFRMMCRGTENAGVQEESQWRRVLNVL
jgi:hypothetical protein